MNQRGLEQLLNDKLALGADVSIARGPVGRTAWASQLYAEILSYSRSSSVFAGIDLSVAVLRPDNANARAYGPTVTACYVIASARRLTALPAAKPFLEALRRNVGAPAAAN